MKQRMFKAEDKLFVYGQIASNPVAPDGWPYATLIDDLHRRFNDTQLVPFSIQEYWRLVLAVRKQKIDRVVDAIPTSARKLDGVVVGRLRELLPKRRGQIDALPYSPAFDELYASLASRMVDPPSRRDIWLTSLKIAKSRIRPAAKPYLNKALASIWRAINSFNMMGGKGRSEAVLIDLHHGFEMLLKAGLIQRQVGIKDANSPGWNIMYAKCVNLAETTGEQRFLEKEDAAYLRALDVIRGLAYHALTECDEAELYLHARLGLSTADKILSNVFDTALADHLEGRVLPICTIPLPTMQFFLDRKRTQIKSLLASGEKERAHAATATLITFENAASGKSDPAPTEKDARTRTREVIAADNIASLFPALSATPIVTDANGTTIHLSLHGKGNFPVAATVDDGKTTTVAVKRINNADDFPLSHHELAIKCGLTTNELSGVVKELKLDEDPLSCYLHGRRNAKTKSKGYSARAIVKVKELVANSPITPLDLWRKNCLRKTGT